MVVSVWSPEWKDFSWQRSSNHSKFLSLNKWIPLDLSDSLNGLKLGRCHFANRRHLANCHMVCTPCHHCNEQCHQLLCAEMFTVWVSEPNWCCTQPAQVHQLSLLLTHNTVLEFWVGVCTLKYYYGQKTFNIISICFKSMMMTHWQLTIVGPIKRNFLSHWCG